MGISELPMEGQVSPPIEQANRQKVFGMLVSRLALFAGVQGLIALILRVAGQADAWGQSAGWWPMTAAVTNFVSIGLLILLFKQDGMRFQDIFRFDRENVRRDLKQVLGVILLCVPLAVLPNILIGQGLFGDFQIPVAMLFRPLPLWAAVVCLVIFPLSIPFAEIPLYYGYVQPRLERIFKQRWPAVLLTAVFHAAQHCTLPLILDGRFILWRLLMFFPFALLLAAVLSKRPRLLPYLIIFHGLIDLQAAVMVLTFSLP